MKDNRTGGKAPGAYVGRRQFAAGSLAAGVLAAAGLGLGAGPAAAASRRAGTASGAGQRVAVFGGGMGGLSAAHELAERGFEVTVYERSHWGGKARSVPVPGTGTGGRPDLPGEHGFRFFPGFYQNIPDTMSRIPRPGGGTVFDNLVSGSEEAAAYHGQILRLPASGSVEGLLTPQSLLTFLQTGMQLFTDVPGDEVSFYAQKLLVFMTSGPKRRLGQWENISYADFVQASSMSQSYRDLLVQMFTSTLVAAKPDKANARTMGMMAEGWAYSTLGEGPYQAPDRVLNGPTNDVFINPWLQYLSGLGVNLVLGSTLTGLQLSGSEITGATVTDAAGSPAAVTADHYVLAVPVERAVPLLNAAILSADPSLKSLSAITTDWMNGVMIYLKQPVSISKGHVAYAGEPWSLTSVNQAQFWQTPFSGFGDGTVNDCLSIDLSSWDAPGVLSGKTAKECTPDQIYAEILAQLRAALPRGATMLPDDIIHSYFIDPDISGPGTASVANDEPLMINTPGSWNDRPDATTGIANLFLASDYVRSDVNLATMEGANEAGRKAANAILDATGSGATRAQTFAMYQPPEFQPVYDNDDERYEMGLPNAFDTIDPYWP